MMTGSQCIKLECNTDPIDYVPECYRMLYESVLSIDYLFVVNGFTYDHLSHLFVY